MKKLTTFMLAVLTVMAITYSCKKDKEAQPQTKTEDVSFAIKSANTGTLKSNDTIRCSSKKANYVKVQVDDSLYKIDVFYINNVPYTNTIKLSPGSHTVKEFTVWSDNNTPNNLADDSVLEATPHSGSSFAGYVTNPLNIQFTVEQFKKLELPIEVVCFQQAYYSKFGFSYFHLNQIVVRQQCLFGDICIKDLTEYTGSLYAQQSHGLQLDMPAIFKIEVWRNGVLQNTYNNEAWKGEGQPLCVSYGDYLAQTDAFEFKLYILVRKATGFSYVYFYSWNFNDAQTIPTKGNTGVVDFALGNCFPDADVIIPSWMNLPATSTYTITGNYGPGSLGGYVDATLSGIPGGYELANGTMASWCADHQTTIYVGQAYNMDVYSSLYPNLLPAFANTPKWSKINWIMNHLDWYPGYKWYDLQGAIWLFDSPAWDGQAHSSVPALNTMQYAQKMYDDANLYGNNYKVPSGGWAAIIFIPTGTPSNATTATVQTMFVKVDP
jgi:hypothetical protein